LSRLFTKSETNALVKLRRCRLKLCDFTTVAMAQTIGMKRRKGRPKHTMSALIYQPTECVDAANQNISEEEEEDLHKCLVNLKKEVEEDLKKLLQTNPKKLNIKFYFSYIFL
jgi:hypothetical protein